MTSILYNFHCDFGHPVTIHFVSAARRDSEAGYAHRVASFILSYPYSPATSSAVLALAMAFSKGKSARDDFRSFARVQVYTGWSMTYVLSIHYNT